MNPGLGYRKEFEDRTNLVMTGKPVVIEGAFTAPKAISHRGWKKAKHQGQMGSCTGASRSSAEEILNYIATGGMIEVFSMMYAYLQNQIACGLIGRDQGATIDGSARASRETGICREATFPYPGHYLTGIPDAAVQEGKLHLIQNHSVMKSYDEYQWLASGVGVVLIGVEWTSGMTQVRKTMERGDLRGQTLGGHAMVLEGYDSNLADNSGRPYIDLENSHGTGWGDGGFTMVAPGVLDQWFGSGETLIGITDLQSYGPRKVPTYQEWMG